jgi:UDP-glucose 4-epimerase
MHSSFFDFAVYGHPKNVPITENEPVSPINPYGWSAFVEKVLEDLLIAKGFRYVSLRYNAAGVDPQARSVNNQTHLIPLILKAAKGERKTLSSTGPIIPRRTALASGLHPCHGPGGRP